MFFFFLNRCVCLSQVTAERRERLVGRYSCNCAVELAGWLINYLPTTLSDANFHASSRCVVAAQLRLLFLELRLDECGSDAYAASGI